MVAIEDARIAHRLARDLQHVAGSGGPQVDWNLDEFGLSDGFDGASGGAPPE
jgi:hypothetical protein